MARPTPPTSDFDSRLIKAAVKWLDEVSEGSSFAFRINAAPAPASRKVSRQGRVYWAAPYALYLSECLQQIAEQREGLPGDSGSSETITGPVGVVVETIVARAKTTKRLWPMGDSDNVAKAPLDACTKAGVWVDDDQVLPLVTTKRYALPGEEPGAIITIGEIRT